MTRIKNTKVYGLEESMVRSGLPMRLGEPKTIYRPERDLKRMQKLSNTPLGTGHSNALKGIVVQFDLLYPQYWTPQLQRYHWFDIVSSQSKMHRLTQVKDVKNQCNKYVLPSVVDTTNILIGLYNSDMAGFTYVDSDGSQVFIKNRQELFMYIISNLPMGYEMWMGITTNYLQLKTMYTQRKNHKLPEWKEFCNWIETLPHSYLITGKDK